MTSDWEGDSEVGIYRSGGLEIRASHGEPTHTASEDAIKINGGEGFQGKGRELE